MPVIPPSSAPLSKKLRIKSNHTVLLLNAPAGYADRLNPLPEGVTVSDRTGKGRTFDFVQLFVHSKADVDRLAPSAIAAVKENGLLWAAYPKISSKMKSDVTRDVGWDTVTRLGWEGIAIVAIDETWSALRFRPAGDVGH